MKMDFKKEISTTSNHKKLLNGKKAQEYSAEFLSQSNYILGKYVVHNFSPLLYKSVSSIYKAKKYLTWLSNYIHCSVNILKDAVS